MRRRHPFLAFAVAISLAGNALAQAANDPADSIIVHGLQLREQGREREALSEFTRAWEMTHTPRARAQMALAEQALGEWVAAYEHMTEALDARSDAWITSRRSVLEEAFAVIRGRVGRLEVSSDPLGAEVRVDNVVRGTTPLARPIALLTGSHALEVRMAGRVTVTRNVTITANALQREPIALVASAATPTSSSTAVSSAPTNPEGPVRGRAPVAPWAVVAVGVVGIAVGAVSWILRGNELEAAARDCGTMDFLGCSDPTIPDPQYGSARAHHANAVTYSWVAGSAFIVGGVAIASGLVWYLVARPRATSTERASRLRFFVAPNAEGAMVGVGGVL